jgi:transposase-like protein
MKAKRSIIIRYSEAFKHQVIKEVEEGHSSCAVAHKKYVSCPKIFTIEVT